MNDSDSITDAWDTYWHGARDGAAFSRGGSSHPAVLAFWQTCFAELKQRVAAPRCIDIASGNGAVIETARAVFGKSAPAFTCVDISPSAVALLRERFPEAQAIVADALAIPFEAGHFDVVTSQFGLEYAGAGALEEAARLVAPGGRIALLLHHADGHIYRLCAQSLDALRQMQQARFLPLCHGMFEAAFAARDGADPAAYRRAGAAFAPAIRAMESIMQQHGREVADGTIVRLYRDVRTIHERLPQYDVADVLGWLDTMQSEIDSYAGRMASMCAAATDAAGFDAMCAMLRGRGFELRRHDALAAPELDGVLAWALIAEKSGDASRPGER